MAEAGCGKAGIGRFLDEAVSGGALLGAARAHPGHQIPGIQYLRGFCASAVVIDHASGMIALPKYFGRTVWSGVLEAGAVGVDLFFVISGFIITIVSLSERTLTPKTDVTDFLYKRAVRILPLMWLAILSYAALRGIFRSANTNSVEYLRALFLIPGGGVEPNVIWTLRHEAVFYLIFAFTFLRKSWLQPILVLWFFSPLIYRSVAGTLLVGPGNSWGDVLFGSANIQFGAGFVIGMAWLRRVRRSPLTSGYSVFFLLCLTVLLIAVSVAMPFPWRSIPTTIGITLLAAPLVLYATRLTSAENWLARSAMLFGNASYSIYLFHLHVLSATLGIAAKHASTVPVGVILIAVVVSALSVGILVHLVVERPLLTATWQMLNLGRAMSSRVYSGRLDKAQAVDSV